MNRGILYGIAAYTIWGFLPLYWKALQEVPAGEILANRIVWSFFFVVLLLTAKRNWGWLKPALKQRRVLLTFAAAMLRRATRLGVRDVLAALETGAKNAIVVSTACGLCASSLAR